MKPRRARREEVDGLQERRRLKLAGVTDEAVLNAVRAPRHPAYRDMALGLLERASPVRSPPSPART